MGYTSGVVYLPHGGATVNRMGGILSWWDGVELWLSGLSFVAQTVVVMPVVLVLAYGIAVLLDGTLGNGIKLLQRVRHIEEDAS
ncbi:hypothetical protein ABIA30_004566 [Mycobacterium sp. MAA66]